MYCSDKDFSYVCSVTFTLEIWRWVKVMTHPEIEVKPQCWELPGHYFYAHLSQVDQNATKAEKRLMRKTKYPTSGV